MFYIFFRNPDALNLILNIIYKHFLNNNKGARFKKFFKSNNNNFEDIAPVFEHHFKVNN